MFGALGAVGIAIGLVLFGLSTIFWIWMLIAAATKERGTAEKIVWVLIILVTHVLGAAIYFFVRYLPVTRVAR
jgi:hypothetical protein